jgi:CRISPR/Cas system CSM-associated protein Csm2 small subunit
MFIELKEELNEDIQKQLNKSQEHGLKTWEDTKTTESTQIGFQQTPNNKLRRLLKKKKVN